jgi:hypothetical protein
MQLCEEEPTKNSTRRTAFMLSPGNGLITVLNISRKEKELAISTKALPELNSDLHDLLGGHRARVENEILHRSPLSGRCGHCFGHFVRAA